MNFMEFSRELESLQRLSNVESEIIGYSALNRPIYMFHVGPKTGKQVFIEAVVRHQRTDKIKCTDSQKAKEKSKAKQHLHDIVIRVCAIQIQYLYTNSAHKREDQSDWRYKSPNAPNVTHIVI